MQKLLSLIVVSLIFILTSIPVLAQTNSTLELPSQKIYPGSMSYPLKRAWEKMWENLPGSKISLYKQLTFTRLAELEYIAKNKRLGEVQTGNERFAFYAGKLTETAKDSERSVKDEIKNDFNKYIEKLKDVQLNFEPNTSYWMLMEHSINSLRLYTEQLEK